MELKKIYDFISQSKAAKFGITILICAAGISLAPLFFGSSALAFKFLMSTALPTVFFFIAGILSNMIYENLILAPLSSIIATAIWALARFIELTPLKPYNINIQEIRKPFYIRKGIESFLYYTFLCGGIGMSIHYNYSLLVIKNFSDLVLNQAFAVFISITSGLKKCYDEYEMPIKHSIPKKLLICTINGLILGTNQIVLGHHLFQVLFGTSFIGAVLVAALVNLPLSIIVPSYLEKYFEKEELDNIVEQTVI